MASVLFASAKSAAFVGATSYAFCRAFNQHNAFEKAVLVTVLVGLRKLAEGTINHLRYDPHRTIPLTSLLIHSTNLLAIPCTLYAGRVFNFKAADYLQIAGLTSIGYSITYGLTNLGIMFFDLN